MDSVKGRDSNPGTSDKPLPSIQAACDRALDGETIVVKSGVYHETVYVNSSVTIQNAPGEAVWLDGSEPVDRWEPAGGSWQAPLPAVLNAEIGPDNGDPYVSSEHPAAAQPEMLFRDGTPLRQMMRKTDLAPGAFYADRDDRSLHIAENPAGHTWHTASLAQAIVVSAPDVIIRGIGVRRYGNSVQTQGAVYLARHNDLLENVVIEDVATTGVTFFSDANQGTGRARSVTVRRAGLMGVSGSNADHLRLQGVLVEKANVEGFNPTPNSAGIKITRSRDVVVESSTVVNSFQTTGIWLDESVVGFGLYRNRVQDNGITGITAELSSLGRIVENDIQGHAFGVVLYSAGDVGVRGNTIRRNTAVDLDIRQDQRRQADPRSVGRDPRYPPGDATNPWLVQNIDIECNVLGPGPAQTRVRVVDQQTDIAADRMNVRFNGNGFAPLANGPVAMWGTGRDDETRDVADPTGLPSTPGRPPNANRATPAPGCSGGSSFLSERRGTAGPRRLTSGFANGPRNSGAMFG